MGLSYVVEGVDEAIVLISLYKKFPENIKKTPMTRAMITIKNTKFLFDELLDWLFLSVAIAVSLINREIMYKIYIFSDHISGRYFFDW